MELWDLYTKDRLPTGRIHVRGEKLPDDLFHLVVHVWIKNSRGQYLISQRAATRVHYPLMWECVGGSVLCGENSLQGALRETQEEVGVPLDPAAGRVLFSSVRETVGGERFNDIRDVWLFHYDGEADLKNATTPEVAVVRWLSPAQIRDLFDAGKLVSTLRYFFDRVDGQM